MGFEGMAASVTVRLRQDNLFTAEEKESRLPRSREMYIGAISELWRQSQENFLTIGRQLVEAAETLEYGQYLLMVKEELPFSYQVSYQLRCVAEAIDGNRLQLEDLPPNYDTIYRLSTLSDQQLELARALEPPLVRQDVKAREVIAFKRQLEIQQADKKNDAARVKRLKRRLTFLESSRARIDEEMTEVKALLAKENGEPVNGSRQRLGGKRRKTNKNI